jgi:hypothetical protein
MVRSLGKKNKLAESGQCYWFFRSGLYLYLSPIMEVKLFIGGFPLEMDKMALAQLGTAWADRNNEDCSRQKDTYL